MNPSVYTDLAPEAPEAFAWPDDPAAAPVVDELAAAAGAGTEAPGSNFCSCFIDGGCGEVFGVAFGAS